jgi:hypothetical protein
MARAAIDRNQTQVARATGCAIGTVHLFERTADEVSKKNAGVIRRHYEEMGVQFWADAYFHIVAVPNVHEISYINTVSISPLQNSTEHDLQK